MQAGRQEIASCQAVIAKEKDLQKAFGTVELPEPLDSSSWLAGLCTFLYEEKMRRSKHIQTHRF